MFPWLWIWSPQLHAPFSGAVTQDIAPEAFFAGIAPASGDGRVERKAFALASYGRQLGWLTEVLLAQAGEHDAVSVRQGAQSLQKLKSLHGRIEGLKGPRRERLVADAEAALARLAESDPVALQRVLRRHAAAPATAEALPALRARRLKGAAA